MTQPSTPGRAPVACDADRGLSARPLVLPAALVVIVVVICCVALMLHGVPAAAALAGVGAAGALGVRVFVGTLAALVPGRSRG